MSWFALATYRAADETRPALALAPDRVHDLGAIMTALDRSGPVPTVAELMSAWPEHEEDICALAEQARELDGLADVSAHVVEPYRPARIFAAASNFVDHADEMGTVLAAKADSQPFVFMKADSSVIGPGESVVIPATSEQVDWEVELAAVIGVGGRDIPVERALDHVAGYSILNDVSARDLNMRTDFPFAFDWFRGKCFDTFAPFGPWVVPARFVPDPQQVGLRLAVNGEVMQDGKTNEMIFTLAEQIAYLSSILTLRPGDVLATGTPDGVGMGRGVYLARGDVMRAEIDVIGVLENPVR
ncbi:fumarylacetoacetate hydrolase family protein [Streptosporangium carneum]|uniref:2-hydroxyhepta-2,4-diene-1,7-dioate isomerase n=1 Tax=Streptosporangium carneum TaxID=47481 RepID=A0A9W6HW04_9ACTN|nr:fumarylacetoacetate hydrolase family protein [Streptosporangium carneum]GLK07072.1 2-hydroxyhepta-2,4-diene-1,7-dioate isomerase [Streptosporangium carneum]